MLEEEKNALSTFGKCSFDLACDCLAMLNPIGAVAKITVGGVEMVVNVYDYRNLRKIDRFICDVNRDERAAEAFRKQLFPEKMGKKNAARIVHDIFQMDAEEKVDYLAFAGINFSNAQKREIFTQSDFFRSGFILASTLSEDLEFLHACEDLNGQYDYNENVQGLVSAGLMYPFSDDKYRFTTFAKKLDQFALDVDGKKYGIDGKYEALPDPIYKFPAFFR